MKKRISMITVLLLMALVVPATHAEYKTDIFDKIKLVSDDLPKGFAFGTLPPFAKALLKENPCIMSRNAIHKLSSQIYPGGDPTKIAALYCGILARVETPYGDDMVCYIILYNNTNSAKNETSKLNEFAGYNQDRAIVITRDNLALFLHVDDTIDMPLLRELAQKLEARLNAI